MQTWTEAQLNETIARQEARLRALEDRQEIIDCTHRFSRGVNRMDRDLLLSAFHPDAVDDHGFYVGSPEGFAEWIGKAYQRLARTQHYVTNHRVEIAGDTAHGECYWFVVNVAQNDVTAYLHGGRYIDRFERRDGRWAIAARVSLCEWNGVPGDFTMPPDVLALIAQSGVCARDRSDLSYRRPLIVDRKPMSAVHPDRERCRNQAAKEG